MITSKDWKGFGVRWLLNERSSVVDLLTMMMDTCNGVYHGIHEILCWRLVQRYPISSQDAVCSVFTISLSRNLSCVDEKAPGVVVGPGEDRLGENPWSNEFYSIN